MTGQVTGDGELELGGRLWRNDLAPTGPEHLPRSLGHLAELAARAPAAAER